MPPFPTDPTGSAMPADRAGALDSVLETVQDLFHEIESNQDSITLAEGRHLYAKAKEVQAWLYSVRDLLATDEDHQSEGTTP